MNSISELRLLTPGAIGLAEPGHRTPDPGSAIPGTANTTVGPAATPAVAAVPPAQAPAPGTPAAEPAANSKPTGAEVHRRFARFENMDYADGIPERELNFGDILDIVNPLQHIPVVGTLYRSITGDEMSQSAGILGGFLYGGPVGFVAAIADTIAEQAAGQDLGEATLAALFGGEDAGDVQLATPAAEAGGASAGIPPRLPSRPAAGPAADSAAADASPKAEAVAALSGQSALDAFVRDVKSAGRTAPAGGDGNGAATEAVPLPPLPDMEGQRPPNPQLAERVRIGAIEPGPMGWTIWRAAETASADRAVPPGLSPSDLPTPAAEISGQAFSERMLHALDKYSAMSARQARDDDQVPRVDTRL